MSKFDERKLLKKDIEKMRKDIQVAQHKYNSTVRRANTDYYKKELYANAKRQWGKKITQKRIAQMNKWEAERDLMTAINKGLNKRWTKKEEKYLIDNYMRKTYLQIAIYLGRTWTGVAHKIMKMNRRKYHDWKDVYNRTIKQKGGE